MQAAKIISLIVPIAFIAIGLLLLLRPKYIANWFKSFARPIGWKPGVKLFSQDVQEKQATSRHFFIKILGTLFSGVGLWAILQVLRSFAI